jgi:hypothetical protein
MPVVIRFVSRLTLLACLAVIGLALHLIPEHPAHAAPPQKKVAAAAQQYVQAMASGDRAAVGRLDFACLYQMVSASAKRVDKFPPDSDPAYPACWAPIAEANGAAVERRELGMDVMWPGQGRLVFFGEDLSRYPASSFVMELLGMSPPGGGLQAEVVDSAPLPAASFRLREDAPIVPATATLVRLRITYKDPLTSPVTYAPGAYKWTNTVKRPRQALKAITLKWVVLSGLRKLGFPGDVAVLNLPVAKLSEDAGGPREAIPFVTETSGAVANSSVWWGPADAPGTLIAAVGRAALFPDQRERVALLNRVLIIDPGQPDALMTLTRDLYASILRDGAAAHKFAFGDPVLASRFDELYWDTYAQTTRMDLALGMEMGGLPKPTTADSLYRMIPAMEKLAQVRAEDLENRLRLGIAYRWNNDQLLAISTHEALLKDTPKERAPFRARVLIHLAWSRIAKVAWNRIFDDPIIFDAYKAAEEAFSLTDNPVDKFAAAYTMAYSLAFTPKRDNHKMLEHLTEARRWFLQLRGASPDSWRYLLANDTLKGVVEADPVFQPLLASSR